MVVGPLLTHVLAALEQTHFDASFTKSCLSNVGMGTAETTIRAVPQKYDGADPGGGLKLGDPQTSLKAEKRHARVHKCNVF